MMQTVVTHCTGRTGLVEEQELQFQGEEKGEEDD